MPVTWAKPRLALRSVLLQHATCASVRSCHVEMGKSLLFHARRAETLQARLHLGAPVVAPCAAA